MIVARGEDTGDDAARFTSIYRRNYSRVLSYALAHDRRDVAEDVVNETFLTAWRKLGEVPQDDPLPWLLRAARNHRLKQRAAGRRRETIAHRIGRLSDERDLVAWDTGDLVAERDSVLAAFASLPEADAEILILSAWYGLDAAQAATVLGCTKALYYVRVHRARRRLTRALHKETGTAAMVPLDLLEGNRS
ncbi:sigma-70 family RNA polymerase sigma factor [Actinoallomurus oryzae]|uniref:Sigma-70 family RNA polymerase sigma factor n=1 Tax=Actinoallomurus oryzae TaxID=502180 RepID=A0ABP8QFF0_9ACTN